MVHISKMSKVSQNTFIYSRVIKHISVREWRRRKNKAEIGPEKLFKKENEECFCLRWAKGAVEVLHEVAESYLVNLLEDANLAIHTRRVTIQLRDIPLAWRIHGDHDWGALCYSDEF